MSANAVAPGSAGFTPGPLPRAVGVPPAVEAEAGCLRTPGALPPLRGPRGVPVAPPGDCGRHAPLRQIAAQPERVREVVEVHVAIVIGEDRREVGAGELVAERVLDHRPQLARLAGDQRGVRFGDEAPRTGALEDLDR